MIEKIYKLIAIIATIIIFLFSISPMVKAATTKNIVLVIDPGHGGKMSGAINYDKGLVERDLTIKIARYMKQYLEEYENITVIMTHNGLPSDVEMELDDRGMVARNNNADMMVSLHLNSYKDASRSGAEVYVTDNTSLPKYNEESTKFANIVLNNLEALGIKNNGVKTRLCQDKGDKWLYSDGTTADYYAVIRYPMKGAGDGRGADLAKGEGIPGILIEHCYIIGSDAKFLDSEEDLQNLAKADANAVVQYYGLEKKSSRVNNITLDKTDITLLKGDKTKITPTITPDTAKNKNVKWSSSNEKVATVSQTGEVTAVGVGTATVTATTEDNAKTATATINVKDITISLDKKEANILVGNKVSVNYTISPDTVTNKNVIWKSSDEGIAKVDANRGYNSHKRRNSNYNSNG